MASTVDSLYGAEPKNAQRFPFDSPDDPEDAWNISTGALDGLNSLGAASTLLEH
jgi:hypothetical protein